MIQINNFFETVLAVDPNTITVLVIVVCVALAVGCFIKKEWSQRLRDVAPALMVSAGIIGTFWGTFIALAEFKTASPENGLDHEAMVESIPMVLAGMKTAFVTTLVGLFAAFGTRVVIRVLPEAEQKPLPIEESTVDLLKQIKDGIIGESDKSLSSQISFLQAEYRDSSNNLKQAISGESESSISSQLTKLRNENSDGFKALDGHLDGLAETIRKSLVENIQTLIEELREALIGQLTEQLKQTNLLLRNQLGEMLDRIEEALIKQFGETFKQFNEATQAIKKWQEDHRQQVEQLTEAFSTTAKGIEKIRTDCESIPATMEQLKNLMGELDERLRAFADMKKAAEQSFPVIKEHLDAIGADLKESASGFSGLEETIRNTYRQAEELAQQHIEAAQQHIEQVGEQINRTAEQVKTTADSMMENSETASNQHLQIIQTMTESVKNEAENMITATRDASKQHQQSLTNIVDTVQRESRRSVTETQNALTEMVERNTQAMQTITDAVKAESENMISESRNVSNQYQQDLKNIIDAVQRESQRCVTETQNSLTDMAEKNAQAISDALASITERWGENMIGITEKMAETINNEKR